MAGTFVGVKQRRWSPESAAEKVNLPEEVERWETMRWSLSKVSSTVMKMPCANVFSVGGLWVFDRWERLYHFGVGLVAAGLLVPLGCFEVAWSYRQSYALGRAQVVLHVPTTSVSLGSSSKKHFWEGPSM